MAREAEELEVEEPNIDDELPSMDEEDDPSHDEETVDDEDLDDTDDEEDAVSFVIGDEEEDDEEDKEAREMPQWVKDLRKSDRANKKRIKELEAEVAARQAPKPKVEKPGAKPTLKQFEYDEEKFEAALTDWHKQNNAYEKAQQEAEEAANRQKATWDETVKQYNNKKKALKIKDFDAIEKHVTSVLNSNQFGMIVDGADNPAVVIAALDAHPEQLEKVAKITNPVKFAFAVSKLETQMKVKARKPKTNAEHVVRGKRGTNGTSDRKLTQLRAEAEKTGDYSKVFAYKRALKNKQK